jgi:TonB family protein
MIKNLTLLILSLLFFQVTKAQKSADTSLYLMKNNGQLAVDKKDADYFMFVMPADSDTKLYPINAYYPNGKPKFIGYSSTKTYAALYFEGPCISFYYNGRKKNVLTYHNGFLLGDVFRYYPNGQFYTLEKNEKEKHLLIECRDSTGKITAENGNGIWLRFDSNCNNETEYGDVKDSLEEGEWKETLSGHEKFVAIYRKGVLISTTDLQRNVEDPVFASVEHEPQFANGGAIGFNAFLARAVKFPAVDRENGTEGNVIITFVVEKDGSLSDIKAMRSPSKSLAAAAIHAVSISPPWEPGMQNGQVVRCQFTISFAFSLSINNATYTK